MVIYNLRNAADTLRQALDGEDAEAVHKAQAEFSHAVKEAWQLYEDGQVLVEMRGLPRLMYYWAVDELPDKIKNPAQWLSIRRELNHFLRVMDLSIKPQEVA